MSDIIKKQIEEYRQNFITNMDSPLGTRQNNETTQFERFRQLLLPLLENKSSDFTICDIGSGISDLHLFLKNSNITHSYTGIEIVPEMNARSKEKYPEINVLDVDFLSEDFKDRFDFVVVSGTFYIPGNVKHSDWETFIYAAVKKIFSLAKIGISFNGLTTYSTFKKDDLFYLDPLKMFNFIQTELSRFAIVNTAYPLYEASYAVFKPEYMKEKHSHPDFAKYFKSI